MSTQPPPPRIYGILAREAPVGVLFRRGPSGQVQVIRWDTNTDGFEFGQWFKGRIYAERADLSPDGKLMVYFAGDMRFLTPSKGTWTAISKPPYLTALARFPQGDTWGGGGVFQSNDRVLVNGSIKEGRIEPGCPLRIGTFDEPCNADEVLEEERLERSGWIVRVPGTMIRRAIGGFLQRTRRGLGFGFVWSDPTEAHTAHLPGVTWADVDQRGRIVFAREGKIFAIDSTAKNGEPQELIDLTPNTFEAVPPADWATRW